MFENYSQYFEKVKDALEIIPEEKRAVVYKMGIASVGAVLAAAAVGTSAVALRDGTQISESLDVVRSAADSADMEIVVAESADGGSLFDGSDAHLTNSDKDAIATRLRENISSDDLADAVVNVIDPETTEVTFTAPDGTPIKATVKKDADGNFSVAETKAEFDQDAVAARKAESKATSSSDEAKVAAGEPLPEFSADAFIATTGLSSDSADADIASHIEALAQNLDLTVPGDFSEQQKPQDAEETAITDKELDRMAPRAKSWRASDGSTITMRTEDLGAAFSQMSGQLAAEKMLGYWQETSSSVAEGSGQSVYAEDGGYLVKTFYDAGSGLWGYWGHVTFADGSRFVSYNRAVFIDEEGDQMFTVSYRHDSTAAEGLDGSMGLDAFKGLFTHAPKADEDADAVVKAADKSHKAQVEDNTVLAGHVKKVSDEKAAGTATASGDDAKDGSDNDKASDRAE